VSDLTPRERESGLGGFLFIEFRVSSGFFEFRVTFSSFELIFRVSSEFFEFFRVSSLGFSSFELLFRVSSGFSSFEYNHRSRRH
jgi:hypothetical protein